MVEVTTLQQDQGVVRFAAHLHYGTYQTGREVDGKWRVGRIVGHAPSRKRVASVVESLDSQDIDVERCRVRGLLVFGALEAVRQASGLLGGHKEGHLFTPPDALISPSETGIIGYIAQDSVDSAGRINFANHLDFTRLSAGKIINNSPNSNEIERALNDFGLESEMPELTVSTCHPTGLLVFGALQYVELASIALESLGGQPESHLFAPLDVHPEFDPRATGIIGYVAQRPDMN